MIQSRPVKATRRLSARQLGYAGLPSIAVPPGEEHPPSSTAAHHASRAAHNRRARGRLAHRRDDGRSRSRQHGRAHRVAVRPGVAARRLPGDARSSSPPSPVRPTRWRRSGAPTSAPAPRRPSARSTPDDPAGVDGDSVTVPVVVDTRVFGALRGNLEHPRVGRARDTGRRGSCSRSCAPASGSRGPACRPSGRPSARVTARCSRRARRRRGRRRSRGSRTRSPAGWSRRRRPRSDWPCTRTGSREDWPVGQTGLEEVVRAAPARAPGRRAFRRRTRAGARQAACRARPVETTIDTRLQEAAVIGLAGRLGGVAALDPRNGEVRALAGIAFSAPAAARLDVQDRDRHGGARARRREAVHRVPDRDARDRRRRGAAERERRGVRRHLPQLASPTRATRCSPRSA